uniref:Microtubule-associated protein 1B/S N-terminal domain-containing protein n=1 Tax=Mastacembelus armatus TaxID=205130 RepID=A0A7N8X198_9TELE
DESSGDAPSASPHPSGRIIIKSRLQLVVCLLKNYDHMPLLNSGIQSWDVDLKSCNLNHYLQEFLSHHTASFKSAGK